MYTGFNSFPDEQKYDWGARTLSRKIRALGKYANWRYEPAQHALIELATNKSADPIDRLNAANAIGYAVR